MKFQGSSHPPPHQDRRLQLRLFGLVAVLGLAMFALQTWRIGSGRGGSSHPHYLNDESEQTPPDDGQSGLRPLAEEEFRISSQEGQDGEDSPDEMMASSENPPRDQNLDIDPSWLSAVRDNTVGIRKSEAEAFYRILNVARSIPPSDLQADADEQAFYADVVSSPESYRGHPITLVGDVVRLYAYEAPENRYRVKQLYDAWIVTSDSGNQPYRVVCQAIPQDLTPGEHLRQPVQVTGYFFKKEAYETVGQKVGVVPTVLAGKLFLRETPYSTPPVDHLVPWLVGVITVIGLAMLATLVGFSIGDSRARRWQPAMGLKPADASKLSDAVDHRLSIAESLRRLENDEPLDDAPTSRESGHGQVTTSEPSDELIDLPTPFPPTRSFRPPPAERDEA